jgi:peptidoglycan/xylan/chitin deacetylase (PgdA/CDA1 family)
MPSLPVLTFHAICDARSPVAVDPATFRRMMERLASAGWKTVTASEAVSFARGVATTPPRRLAITFDDGYASVLEHAAPALRDVGFTAALFVPVEVVGRPVIFPGDGVAPRERALSWDEIGSLAASGFEIGSHASAHRELTALADADLEDQLEGSRHALEERLGAPVLLHAYPFGACDARVARACARVYEGAFTTRLDRVRRGDDPHLVPRLDAHYLRFLAHRGDLDGAASGAWLALRRAARSARALFSGRKAPR